MCSCVRTWLTLSSKGGHFPGTVFKNCSPAAISGWICLYLAFSFVFRRVVFRETNRTFRYSGYRRTQICLSLHGTIGPSYLYFHPFMNIDLKAPLRYLENWIYFWIQNFWITEDDPSLWTTGTTLSLGSGHILDSNWRILLQTALERHVNGHFNQPETSNNNARRSCESGGKLVRRNGKRLRYRRQPWSGKHRLLRFLSLRDLFFTVFVTVRFFVHSETLRLLRLRGDGGSSAQVTSTSKVEDARSSRGDTRKFDGPN